MKIEVKLKLRKLFKRKKEVEREDESDFDRALEKMGKEIDDNVNEIFDSINDLDKTFKLGLSESDRKDIFRNLV